MTAALRIIEGGKDRPKRRPPKSYKAWLKAKGFKAVRVERTQKRIGEYEFDRHGKLVKARLS